MVHKYSHSNDAETIEVSNEQIAAGVPVLLQVRRGSESALNQLLSDENVDNGQFVNGSRQSSKRWSAAAPLSQEPKERYIKKDELIIPSSFSRRNRKWTHEEEDENEERDIFPPRRTSGFARDGSNRLSMQFVGDSAGGLKWAEAADRLANSRVFSMSLPRDNKRKEPFGQNSSNVQNSTEQNKFSENIEYVVLRMDDEALGIHVVPDYDQLGNDRGLLVQRIEPGGKVDRDGRLAVNDRIIEINDRPLLNQSFNEVQEIFRDSLRSPELRLRVVKHQQLTNGFSKKQAPPPVFPKPSTSHQKHPLHNKENIGLNDNEKHGSPVKKTQVAPLTGSNILMAVNTRKIGRIVELELTKSQHGLGFSVTTRDNPIGGHCPIYIRSIKPKGAAVEDGRLRCGDRLLSVNDVDLNGKTQADVVSALRSIPMGGRVKLVVSRQEDVPDKIDECDEIEILNHDDNDNNDNAIQPLKIEREQSDENDSVQKQSSQGVDQSSIFPWRQREILTFNVPVHDTEKAGLGISVKGKTSTNHKSGNDAPTDMGIFINSVIHGGAASRDGRVRMNDQLLSVNGVSLLGLSNSAAMETLRRAILHTEGPKSGAITLTVARRIGGNSASKRRDSSSSLLTDSSANTETFGGRIEHDSSAPTSTDNSGNSEQSDNTVIFLPPRPKSPPEIVPLKNPVLERLTGQLPNQNALRNESYYRATHQTSMMFVGKETDRLTSPTVNQSPGDIVIIEEDPSYSNPSSEPCNSDQAIPNPSQKRGSTSTQATDVTYTSQLSLEDGAVFSRDAFGRQSMSEKRHATLDAKNTDTYQRTKKQREEREKMRSTENRRSTGGVMKVNSTESIPKSDKNEIFKNQLGPSLGMKKSSSLESLQTMVQEIQMAEDGSMYRRTQMPVKVVRGRGCNESFRAAVDRSYEGPPRQIMEPVPEDGGFQFAPRQSSLNSQLDCKMIKQQQNQKKKSSLLKGLGSMFRFGKHRKPAVLEEISQPSHFAVNGKPLEENDMDRARRIARDEQQRIQEQYKILMQNMQQQQQFQHQQQLQRNSGQAQYIQTNNVNINNTYLPIPANIINNNFNNEQLRMSQMRSQQHYKYVDRRSLFPPETKEEFYNGVARQSFRQHESEPPVSVPLSNRSSGRYTHLPESNRYSHYVNYEEIQQHINRKQQHYHSQRRDTRDMTQRPVSNFYEYESVQAMMQNNGVVRPSFVDSNVNPARNEFFPSHAYGSTRTRNQDARSYSYQNSVPIQQPQFGPYGYRPSSPLYSNIRHKAPGPPYVTHVTIRDNSLGTKV